MRKKNKKYNIGLVMSGGGVRGFAHLGAIKALEEAGLVPDVISGVSAGAIAGALYADGHSPDKIIKMFKETKLLKYVEITLPGKSIFKMTGLSRLIQQNLKAKTFEELKTPLFVTATNLSKGVCEYFNSGELLKRVMASATIPVLFPPLYIDGNACVDGGVINNFPIEPIEKLCDFIIGIHVNYHGYTDKFNSIIGIAERSFQLAFYAHLSPKAVKCDIFIEPQALAEYKLLDVSKIQEIFAIGYKETRKIIKENKEVINAVLMKK